MKKILGYSILTTLALLLFYIVASASGVVFAIVTFGGALVLFGLVMLAVYLISD